MGISHGRAALIFEGSKEGRQVYSSHKTFNIVAPQAPQAVNNPNSLHLPVTTNALSSHSCGITSTPLTTPSKPLNTPSTTHSALTTWGKRGFGGSGNLFVLVVDLFLLVTNLFLLVLIRPLLYSVRESEAGGEAEGGKRVELTPRRQGERERQQHKQSIHPLWEVLYTHTRKKKIII
jgi:hypothetical protein